MNEQSFKYGSEPSVIRELFEYGNKRKEIAGEENVYDYSLGNPSIPAPDVVNQTLIKLITETPSTLLHGYTSGPGDMAVRKKVADYISDTFKCKADAGLVYMTVGAAASVKISLNAVVSPGEEVLTFAPFFPEYRVFAEGMGASFKPVLCKSGSFQPDIEAFENAVTEKTTAVIINSPNNPSGVVFGTDMIKKIADVLDKKQREYAHPIYIISDEPYRELVYDDTEVPYIPNYYGNTIVAYSFSKSLSLPGERIGYIFVSPECADAQRVFAAVCGAGRRLGFVCAPSLFQKLIPYCLGKTSDISAYKKNRDLLCAALTEYGYEFAEPGGAFYLFVKSLEPDAKKFSDRAAKNYDLLLVPSDSFGVEGYVRISYCVSEDMIRRSLPAFKALAEEYR